MRIGTILFSILFLVQGMDIPPIQAKAVPHTCCGRAICLCRHAKGAACPLRLKQNIPSTPPAQGHCHLHNKGAAAPAVVATKPDGKSVFTEAPCSTNTPKTLLPSHSRDYEYFFNPSPAQIPSQKLFRLSNSTNLIHRSRLIERPPRLSSPFLFHF